MFCLYNIKIISKVKISLFFIKFTHNKTNYWYNKFGMECAWRKNNESKNKEVFIDNRDEFRG